MRARFGLGLCLGLALSAFTTVSSHAAPLKIGYSDWPGWTAWQVAIDKGWFKQANVDVVFNWFDYSASLDAFSAGKIDAELMTNGDALVIGAGGAKSQAILLTDYSSGNDIIVAQPGIKSLKQLKGKKIGIEVGLVEHLLLLYGLEQQGMKITDVTLVNTKTNDTPQVLASGQVDAIGAWQPNSGQAMQMVPGARPVFSSAQAPGLIYDELGVSPTSLAAHKAEWAKVVQIWDKVVKYINDPKTQDDAIRIMCRLDGLTPEQYKPLLKGTHLLDLAANRKAFKTGPGLDSLHGSSINADKFNVDNAVYKTSQDVDSYIDAELIRNSELVKAAQ
ncbi:MAG TPA: ABC transporter substrate-binding protein [Stellaceae bacterium]|nr:ABC transporter substrate-binding protein [Stellaceae bacterium]